MQSQDDREIFSLEAHTQTQLHAIAGASGEIGVVLAASDIAAVISLR